MVSYLVPCSHVCFAVLFSIAITLLGEERAGLYTSLEYVAFCLFSLPLGVGDWLRIAIMASLDFSLNFLTNQSLIRHVCHLATTINCIH